MNKVTLIGSIDAHATMNDVIKVLKHLISDDFINMRLSGYNANIPIDAINENNFICPTDLKELEDSVRNFFVKNGIKNKSMDTKNYFHKLIHYLVEDFYAVKGLDLCISQSICTEINFTIQVLLYNKVCLCGSTSEISYHNTSRSECEYCNTKVIERIGDRENIMNENFPNSDIIRYWSKVSHE